MAVAVVAGDGAALLPCGRCRQLLLEAGGPGAARGHRPRPGSARRAAARRVRRRRPVRPPGAGVAASPQRPSRDSERRTHARRGIADPAQAGQRPAADRPGDRLAVRGLRGARGGGRADGRAADGDLLQRPVPGRAARVDGRDDRLGRAARPHPAAQADRGQALDRWRRRQGVADPRPAGGELRRRRAPAFRPRPRAHRRHARQARVDPRLARHPRQRRADRGARPGRRGHRGGRAPGSPRRTAGSTRCAT